MYACEAKAGGWGGAAPTICKTVVSQSRGLLGVWQPPHLQNIGQHENTSFANHGQASKVFWSCIAPCQKQKPRPVPIRVCMCMSMYVYIHEHTCIHVYICICIYVHAQTPLLRFCEHIEGSLSNHWRPSASCIIFFVLFLFLLSSIVLYAFWRRVCTMLRICKVFLLISLFLSFFPLGCSFAAVFVSCFLPAWVQLYSCVSLLLAFFAALFQQGLRSFMCFHLCLPCCLVRSHAALTCFLLSFFPYTCRRSSCIVFHVISRRFVAL